MWGKGTHRLLRCCAEPRHCILPPTMMPMRVHSASHSSMLCVVSTTEQDWSWVAIFTITFHMNRRDTGSIPVDGSSRNTIAGSPMVAMATLSLRLFPPEYVPTYSSTRTMTTK